jgi:hypothetical protein
MNSFGGNRNDELLLHPTAKPAALIADAIKDLSRRNDIALHPFGGSGSTLIAAHKTGRRAFLCALDPLYCDRIIRRWQTYARDDAILEATSASFEHAADGRRKPITSLPGTIDQLVTETASAALGASAATAPIGGADEHLVCWLPPFHPMFGVPSATPGEQPRQAAE